MNEVDPKISPIDYNKMEEKDFTSNVKNFLIWIVRINVQSIMMYDSKVQKNDDISLEDTYAEKAISHLMDVIFKLLIDKNTEEGC
jgi:hypothetical protein